MHADQEHIPLQSEQAHAGVKDQFHRRKFAQRLAYAVANRPDREPFIIGLAGSWGEGKSTVLSYMSAVLEERFPEVILVRFNPWMGLTRFYVAEVKQR